MATAEFTKVHQVLNSEYVDLAAEPAFAGLLLLEELLMLQPQRDGYVHTVAVTSQRIAAALTSGCPLCSK